MVANESFVARSPEFDPVLPFVWLHFVFEVLYFFYPFYTTISFIVQLSSVQ
jgi:hypothetical protein